MAASVIGIQHSRAALRSIVDPSRTRQNANTVVRNRGPSTNVLKAAFPNEQNVAINIGVPAELDNNKSDSVQPKKGGRWLDVFTHLGIVFVRKTPKNEEIYQHRRSQHYCWSTLQRGGADALVRFIVYSVYLAIVLIAQAENDWSFEISADVHYMYWSKNCPGNVHECSYHPKHYRHQHKTDLLLFIGIIGWVYAGMCLDLEIFEILYRKDVEFIRRWLRIAFTAVLLVIGSMLNGQTDIINLMFMFTLTMAFFVQIESFKKRSEFSCTNSVCSTNLERVFLASIILAVWSYSLVPTIITWADDNSKTPELVWVVNFILFFMLWATEIVMLWSGKCRNKYTVALMNLMDSNKISNDPAQSLEDFKALQKNIEVLQAESIPEVQSKSLGFCRSRHNRDNPPFSKLVSFQIVCQVIQDTIFVSYLTAILMYSI